MMPNQLLGCARTKYGFSLPGMSDCRARVENQTDVDYNELLPFVLA